MEQPNNLRKVLGVAFGMAIVVGSTIGVGILRAPASIAALIPDPTLILCSWGVIGIYIVLSASSYAELTTMMPKAGGAYNYIKRAFGDYPGFLNGWFDFLTNAIAPAYFCIVLSEYSIMIFPQLAGFDKVVAIIFLTVFALINLPGVKGGSVTQKVSSALKIILFLILVIGCFSHQPLAMPHAAGFKALNGLLLFQALQLIMGAYDGWMSVSFFAEEDSDPGKNIPKSYLIGALTVAVLYILINAAVLYVLPVDRIAQSPLAASEAASVALGPWSGSLMIAVAVFSLVSILNAYMMIPSRILYGMSRDGYFFSRFMTVNKGGTPYYALLLCYVFAIVLILASSFETLFRLAVFMMTIVTGFAFASLIKLRYSEPDLPRPYKAFGYPYTTALSLLVTIVLLFGFAHADPFSLYMVLGFATVSFLGYRLWIKGQKR